MASKNDENMTPEEKALKQEQIRAEHKYVIKDVKIRRQTRRRTVVIILSLFLLIMAVFAGATYAIMKFADDSNFRISVSQTGTSWLTLSKDAAFTNPTSVLDVSAPKNMDNCTLCNYLDDKLLDIYNNDGPYEAAGSSEYFIASTFYLKNSGKTPVKYKEQISIECMTKGMEKAVRILLIKEQNINAESKGVIRVFADYACDENGKTIYDSEGNPVVEEVVPASKASKKYRPTAKNDVYSGFTFPEGDINEDGVWLTEGFQGDGYVLNSEYFPLNPEEIIKYSVIVWLEGADDQCVDSILGGQLKLSVEFAAETE